MIRWYYALLLTTATTEAPVQNGGGFGFVSTGSDAASLWRGRKQQIEELMRARRQPRVIVPSR